MLQNKQICSFRIDLNSGITKIDVEVHRVLRLPILTKSSPGSPNPKARFIMNDTGACQSSFFIVCLFHNNTLFENASTFFGTISCECLCHSGVLQCHSGVPMKYSYRTLKRCSSSTSCLEFHII